MANSRKVRGRETEILLAQYLAANGFPYALPTGSGTPGTDITGTPGITWEAKARAGFNPLDNLRQVLANTPDGNFSEVVLRCNGQGPASIGMWPVFKPLYQEILLLRQAGFGVPVEGSP